MFSKHRNNILAGVCTLLLSASLAWGQTTTSQPQPQPGKEGRHSFGMDQGFRHGGHMGHHSIFRQLDLTDAQKEQIKQIHLSHQDAMKSIFQQLRAKQQELKQAMGSNNFDEALATQKLSEEAPLKAKMMAERFKIHQETLAVLTPEQRAKMDQLREQFKAKHSQRKTESF